MARMRWAKRHVTPKLLLNPNPLCGVSGGGLQVSRSAGGGGSCQRPQSMPLPLQLRVDTERGQRSGDEGPASSSGTPASRAVREISLWSF